MNNRNSSHAFTLIELLVVIAIIAILAAILFPVFAQAKMAAKKATTVSNMKQMVLGSLMYANDYDDNFSGIETCYPNRPCFDGDYATEFGYVDGWENVNSHYYYTTWQNGLDPYLKNDGPGSARVDPVATNIARDPWNCTTSDTLAAYGAMLPDQPFSQPLGAHYTSNIAVAPSKGCSSFQMNGIAEFKPTTAMPAPANTVIIREASYLQSSARLAPWNFYGIYHYANTGWAMIDGGGLDNTYNNGGVFGWADGHAKYSVRTGIHFSDFGCTGTLIKGNTPYTGSLDPTVATLAADPTLASDDRNLYCPTTAF